MVWISKNISICFFFFGSWTFDNVSVIGSWIFFTGGLVSGELLVGIVWTTLVFGCTFVDKTSFTGGTKDVSVVVEVGDTFVVVGIVVETVDGVVCGVVVAVDDCVNLGWGFVGLLKTASQSWGTPHTFPLCSLVLTFISSFFLFYRNWFWCRFLNF